MTLNVEYDEEMANPPTRADFDTAGEWLDDAGRRRLASPTTAEMRAIVRAMRAEEPGVPNKEIIRRLGIASSQFYRDLAPASSTSDGGGQ